MLWSLAEREMDLETLICVDLVQVVMGRKLMHLQRARYPDGWWIHTVDMFGLTETSSLGTRGLSGNKGVRQSAATRTLHTACPAPIPLATSTDLAVE